MPTFNYISIVVFARIGRFSQNGSHMIMYTLLYNACNIHLYLFVITTGGRMVIKAVVVKKVEDSIRKDFERIVRVRHSVRGNQVTESYLAVIHHTV